MNVFCCDTVAGDVRYIQVNLAFDDCNINIVESEYIKRLYWYHRTIPTNMRFTGIICAQNYHCNEWSTIQVASEAAEAY